jgi:phosphoribosylformylglycinamidine cyclo-ligase
VAVGDELIGLPSSGVHSNGFSLVRKLCFDIKGFKMDTPIPEFGCTLGEKLLTPTRLYPKSCLPLIRKFDIHGMVHITGSGFYGNVPRVLPKDCDALIDAGAWPMPVVFKKLQEWGNIDWKEMYTTFNMGIGMILVVSPQEADAVRAELKAMGETYYNIGKIVPGHQTAVLKGGVFGA